MIALVLLILRLDIKLPQIPFRDGVKAIDWLGNAFFTIGTSITLIPLPIGDFIVPWKSPQVLCPLLLSPLALGLFALVEKKFATHPIMPFRFFNSLSKASISVINVTQSLLTTGSIFFPPYVFKSCSEHLLLIQGCTTYLRHLFFRYYSSLRGTSSAKPENISS